MGKLIFNGDRDVIVIVEHDGIEDWRGTFSRFVADNNLTVAEIFDADRVLSAGQTWSIGGGAAAEFTVRLA